MKLLLPFSAIFVGIFLVSLGGVLVPRGLQLLPPFAVIRIGLPEVSRQLWRSGRRIGFGTLLLLFGSLLGGWGWGELSTRDTEHLLTQASIREIEASGKQLAEEDLKRRLRQKLALLSLVNTEVRLNGAVLKDIASLPAKPVDVGLVFPQFLTQGVGAALASGAFAEAQDEKLLKAFFVFQVRAQQINTVLGAGTVSMMSFPPPAQRKALRVAIVEGEHFAKLQSALNELKATLLPYQASEAQATPAGK